MQPRYDWHDALERGEVDIFGDAPPTSPPASRRRRRQSRMLPVTDRVTYGPTYQQSAATAYFHKRIIETCDEIQVNLPGQLPRRDQVSAGLHAAASIFDAATRNQIPGTSTPEQGSGPAKLSIEDNDSSDAGVSVSSSRRQRIDSLQTSPLGRKSMPIQAEAEDDDDIVIVRSIYDDLTTPYAVSAPKAEAQEVPSIFHPGRLVDLAGALPIPFGDKPWRGPANKMIKWSGSKQSFHRRCTLFLLGHSTKCGLQNKDMKKVFTHIFPQYLGSLSEEPSAQKFGSQLGMHTYAEKPRHSDWDELVGLLPLVGWKSQCMSDCEKAVQLALSQLDMQPKTPIPCKYCAAWPGEVARKKKEKESKLE